MKNETAFFVVGIEGEVMYGLGRTVDEAWRDALRNADLDRLRARCGDVQTYEIPGRYWAAAEEQGDGWRNNCFTGFHD